MLVVVDTSFWIDFARGSISVEEREFVGSAMQNDRVVLPQLVWLELLVGLRSRAERQFLEDVKTVCRWEPLNEADGHEAGVFAGKFRLKGIHLAASDLLIFTVARRLRARLLHHDRDFDRVL